MRVCLFGIVTVLGVGCTGIVAEGTTSDESAIGPSGAPSPAAKASSPGGPAPSSNPPPTAIVPGLRLPERARIWRLTNRQYDNTVADLLGDRSAPGARFLTDVGGHGFANNAELSVVNDQGAVQYQLAAQQLAAALVADDARVGAVLPCKLADMGADACGRQFVQTFGQRAFRRPLAAEEVSDYFRLYATTRGELDPRTALQLVVETMLQSPAFLYRTEVGAAPATRAIVRLTPHETASALSYYLWDTMPDAALAMAASNNALATASQRALEVMRLLESPRSRPVLVSYFHQLFGYRQLDSASRPGLANFAALRASMAGETEAFIRDLLDGPAGTLSGLLTSPHSYVDGLMRTVYGLPRMDGATTFSRVDLDPMQRAGVLTHPGFLAAHSLEDGSNPPRRGRFVLERLLCQEVPDPPDNVEEPPKVGNAPETTRQRFVRITSTGSCMGCHALLNPPGFAFENYDENGRFRTREGTLPVDANVDVRNLPGLGGAGTVTGAVQLAKALATAPAVLDCFVRQAFRFAFGRSEGSTDAGYLEELAGGFRQTKESLKALPAIIALSDGFVERAWP